MKKFIKLPAIMLGLLLLLTGTTQRVLAQDDDISLQSFYDELSPYGTWIQDPEYGYVWRPDVEQGDFRPYYTNGRWAMTEYGNTWVSNYDWGWAPFHYGRWVYNSYRQWIWIPDTVWGPAWVSWRSGGGYYGWAPMGPGFNVNVNIGIPDLWWVFVPQRNIYYDSFPRYYSRRNVTIIHNTTIINNTYVRNRRTYYSGPRIDDLRRATRSDVAVYNINRSSRSGRTSISGNNVNIYNPGRSRADRGSVQAPREVVKGDEYVTRSRTSADRSNTATRGNATTPGRTEGTRPSRGSGVANGNGTAPERENVRGNTNPSRENGSMPSRTPRSAETGNSRAEAAQQQQRQQRQSQNQSQRQQSDQQRQQQTGQQRQQRQSQEQSQRQQADQQRQQQAEQQRQQRQSQEQAQRQQADQQRQQQAEQQRQQRQNQEQAQRQQADQQRQQQAEQQRQQRQSQEQSQRQQQQQSRPERVQQSQPSRSSEGRSSSGSSRPSRTGRGG